MSLLIIPHLTCNLHCLYCYEKKYRKTHSVKMEYDLGVILKKMEELKNIYPDMCLHGGEPLMMPKKDVRAILLKMKELTGKSDIQTNGTLIDDDFIKIFKESSTTVGLSYDGPGELSEYRFHRLKKDPEIDKKIEKMIKQGISVSLIMVITKANAGTNQRLKKLKNYLLKLDKMQISGRLNPCGGAQECELDEKRIKQAYLDLANFCLIYNLRWSPFTDIIDALQGKSRVCTFMGCDPFHTPSAAEMLEDGNLTNCMRTNQEYMLLRHPIKQETRKEILSQTPQKFGGCQNCKYWSACYGGCPTMAIDNDWRNRTYLCALWQALFQFYEKVLSYCNVETKLCQTKDETEESMASQEHGDSGHGDAPHGNSGHADHIDKNHSDGLPNPRENLEHGNSPHGDAPHGDSGHPDQIDDFCPDDFAPPWTKK